MGTRRLAAVLALALIVATNAGCARYFGCVPDAPDDIAMSDLAGAFASSDGGTISLREDGHFSVRGVPGFATDAAEGTWTLDIESATTEDLMLGDVQVWISGDRERPWLYRFTGDPDNCDLVEYHRNG